MCAYVRDRVLDNNEEIMNLGGAQVKLDVGRRI